MDAKGWDITALSKAMSISFQAVAKVRDGGAFGKDNNFKAAKLFGLEPEWLSSGKGPKKAAFKEANGSSEGSNVTPLAARAKVPLISWIQAGELSDVLDIFHPGEAVHWTEVYYSKPSDRSYALRVEGDSMTSQYPGALSFPEGTVIVVDPDAGYQPGDYVVAKDVSTQKATFKQLMSDGSRWYLKPINSSYPTIEIDEPSLRVIGKVVEYQPPGGKL